VEQTEMLLENIIKIQKVHTLGLFTFFSINTLIDLSVLGRWDSAQKTGEET
jgi:hypothetical protein